MLCGGQHLSLSNHHAMLLIWNRQREQGNSWQLLGSFVLNFRVVAEDKSS